MRFILGLASLSALVISSPAKVGDLPALQPGCIENAELGLVECIFTALDSVFEFPEIYSNMTINIYGASSGRALGVNNCPEDRTRGLGLHFSAAFADNLKDVTWEIHNGENGQDARIDGPGLNKKSGVMDIDGGDGGWCNGSDFARYGASGASGSGIMRRINFAHTNQMFIYLGAAGGPGAFDPYGPVVPKGGDVPMVYMDENGSGNTQGNEGHPVILSGTGGRFTVPGLGGISRTGGDGHNASAMYRGGNGGDGFAVSSHCLSGGGGGVGHRAGGGGAAVGSNDTFHGAAGSGGSGASVILADPGFVYNIKQQNVFTEHPRVIFRYSRTPPKNTCMDGLCVIMRK